MNRSNITPWWKCAKNEVHFEASDVPCLKLCSCLVNGHWTNWSQWSSCSASCNGGARSRRRSCTNPPPSNGGAHCRGISSQTQLCNRNHCQISGMVWPGRFCFVFFKGSKSISIQVPDGCVLKMKSVFVKASNIPCRWLTFDLSIRNAQYYVLYHGLSPRVRSACLNTCIKCAL